MKCPRCKTKTIREIRYENFVANQCSSCNGFWLSRESLISIVETKEQKFSTSTIDKTISQSFEGVPEAEVANELDCPVCNKSMNSSNFGGDSGIIVDHCPHQHGTWFDYGELEKVQAYREYWDQSVDSNELFFSEALKDSNNTLGASVKPKYELSTLYLISIAAATIVDDFLNKLHGKS